MVAIKMYEDDLYDSSFYGRVIGGLYEKEITILEKDLLIMINFNTVVTLEAFDQYYDDLGSIHEREYHQNIIYSGLGCMDGSNVVGPMCWADVIYEFHGPLSMSCDPLPRIYQCASRVTINPFGAIGRNVIIPTMLKLKEEEEETQLTPCQWLSTDLSHTNHPHAHYDGLNHGSISYQCASRVTINPFGAIGRRIVPLVATAEEELRVIALKVKQEAEVKAALKLKQEQEANKKKILRSPLC